YSRVWSCYGRLLAGTRPDGGPPDDWPRCMCEGGTGSSLLETAVQDRVGLVLHNCTGRSSGIR
ncbi:hypothetical protein FOZ62_022613, partial [Perkinsus olseni]